MVASWHQQATIDLTRSSYLLLAYDAQGFYQLFQFPLQFPQNLDWHIPQHQRGGQVVAGNLRGVDDDGVVFEWFGESGGQLKYYPRLANAQWVSAPFELEPLPATLEDGLIAKVKTYFPQQWQVNQ